MPPKELPLPLLPRSERRLVERLKIEQLHEKLLNILPFYGKVTLALIPSLRSSVDSVNNCHQSDDDEGKPPKEDFSAIDENEKIPSGNEDIDVALPLGEKGALNSFLNTLTTALFYAGSEPIKSVRNILYDRPKSPKNGKQIEGRTESEIDEQQKLHNDITSALDMVVAEDDEMVDIPDAEPNLAPLNVDQDVESDSNNSSTSNISTEPQSRASIETAHTIPLESDMTPWQKSVFQKINFVSQNENTLFKYTTEIHDDDPAFERLPWFIAKKLKEIFDLLDSDQFQGVFQSWLVRDVLLLGNVYLTSESLCFYSLLPGALAKGEDLNQDIKLYEGALGFKLGHYGDSYYSLVATHNFWAILKFQNLFIYPSSTELFFPVKVIDLRDALYCDIIESPNVAPSPKADNSDSKLPRILSFTLLLQLESETSSLSEETEDTTENFQGGVWFRIVCSKKSYKFYTKNIFSARHWCNSITKEIFRLHNANSKREVLLKIPLDRIIELKKNYVLAESDEEAATDTDTPVTFTVKYDTQKRTNSSDLDKTTKDDTSEVPEFVHFVLFGQGKQMQETVSKLIQQKRNGDQKNENQSEDETKSESTILSTLRSQLERGVSIIDKIALVNEELLTSEERKRYIPESGENDCLPKKKKSARSNNNSVATSPHRDIGDDNIHDDLEEVDLVTDGINWHFPKPFSVLTLKSLNLHISTKKKDAAEMETHYASLMEGLKGTSMRESPSTYTQTSELDYSQSFENSKNDSNLDNSSTQSLESSSRGSRLQTIKKLYSIGKGITANPQHYDTNTEDEFLVTSGPGRNNDVERFRREFLLGPGIELIASYHAFLRRKIPVYGKLYLGYEKLFFQSLLPGVSTKMILPLKKLDELQITKGRMVRNPGLKIYIHGGDPLLLDFGSLKARDDCRDMIQAQISRVNSKIGYQGLMEASDQNEKTTTERDSICSLEIAKIRSKELVDRRVRAARLRLLEDRVSAASGMVFPIILAEDPIFFTEVRSSVSYKFTLLTIGSRGDVQPYISLGKALMAEGHVVTIATHAEFEDWIVSHGLQFKEVAGDPAELMALMVKHGAMSVGFLKEAAAKFRGWVAELLTTSWEACQGTDVLIESPSAMSGLHIAEALGIPYMRAFTMPWTRTRAYPHAFVVPDQRRGGSYNILTHIMFETVFWKGISGQVNKWRTETLGLKRTNLVKMQQTQIPFLYNVSPEVFPPSVDFPDWVRVTGYWFLDEGSNDFTPPEDLVHFLAKARADNKKIVYVGFGSIVVSDSNQLTQAVVDAVLALGVRCVLNKGWSDRLSKDESRPEVKLPEQIFNSSLIPHDWLFPQIDAAVHHGGSGTTGATLRSGLPTIIKPFFGDQFFYASRIEELGVGIALKKLNAKTFTSALKAVTTNDSYAKKAKAMSKNIKCEYGVLEAVADIYSEFAYSKSLIDSIRLNDDLKSANDDESLLTPGVDSRSLDFTEDDLKIDQVTLG